MAEGPQPGDAYGAQGWRRCMWIMRQKLHIVDPESGEMIPVEVFVAILGASQFNLCGSQL